MGGDMIVYDFLNVGSIHKIKSFCFLGLIEECIYLLKKFLIEIRFEELVVKVKNHRTFRLVDKHSNLR